MAALDASIVNVAAPRIQDELRISGASLVLALSGYTLAYAMLLITGARLGVDYGHKRLFVTGLAGFTLASLSCGLAPTGAVLIASRLIRAPAQQCWRRRSSR
jgi:MFS family permease